MPEKFGSEVDRKGRNMLFTASMHNMYIYVYDVYITTFIYIYTHIIFITFIHIYVLYIHIVHVGVYLYLLPLVVRI